MERKQFAGRLPVVGGGAWVGNYLVASQTNIYPERVKVGQTDIGASSSSDLTMVLVVDYWNCQLGNDTVRPWVVSHWPSGPVVGPVTSWSCC